MNPLHGHSTGNAFAPRSGHSSREGPAAARRSIPPGFIVAIVAIVVLFMVFGPIFDRTPEISYGFFRQQLEAENIASLDLQGLKVTGEFVDPPPDPTGKTDRQRENQSSWTRSSRPPFRPLPTRTLDDLILEKLKDKYKVTTPPDTMYFLYLLSMVGLPLLMVVGVFFMLRRTQNSIFGGGGILGFSKSPARKYEQGERRVTFNDVAGLEGVKAELQEIVEFLKNPKKFQRLGGRVPKGILLMGPPGTGKTLLGRAVAGEAGVPFYSINGSEFIQMFVGVGAGRVRDLFATAKESSPCILFIDEIDAVGRHRGTGVGGGNDEREQTLNQILSEMDGFTQTEAVIVMAATNRPDVLDPALLRPGRFDRHITVDRPTYKGRLAIFGVHTRGIPLADDVDLERLAAGSVGLTGADIRNLVNEATLWASCHDKEEVEMSDFDYARDKVLMGAKREEVLSGKEKTLTAYHEAGHTLIGWLLPGADHVHKVSIIPRGRALGRDALPAGGGPRQHQREQPADLPADRHGRPRGREAGLRRIQRRGRERFEPCHAHRPPHGHPLGHERAAGPGDVPRQRGPSVPGSRDRRAAAFQRAHGPAHRRGGVADSPRRLRPCRGDAHAASRQARMPGQGVGSGRDARRRGDRETLGPPAWKTAEAASNNGKA